MISFERKTTCTAFRPSTFTCFTSHIPEVRLTVQIDNRGARRFQHRRKTNLITYGAKRNTNLTRTSIKGHCGDQGRRATGDWRLEMVHGQSRGFNGSMSLASNFSALTAAYCVTIERAFTTPNCTAHARPHNHNCTSPILRSTFSSIPLVV